MERIEIVRIDITKLKVKAIVNAANTRLAGGGGVDGAIHEAAGPELLKECQLLEGCPTGQAKVTKGYNLYADYVIHAVGPIWRGGSNQEHKLLRSCYRSVFQHVENYRFLSVAFPAISCGVYGFPLEEACEIAVKEVCSFLSQNRTIEKIFFSCFSPEIEEAYRVAYSREMEGGAV